MARVLVAVDKFRGSLTGPEAADAITRGLRAAGAFVERCAVADGGEGTLDALVSATGGTILGVVSRGPRGIPVRAHIGMLPDGTGIVELAQASGLSLLEPAQRRPIEATSHGTGECIKAVLARKPSRVLVGLGGSATIDAGLGIARALGVGFYDREGKPVADGVRGLEETVLVDLGGLDRRLTGTDLLAACDVDDEIEGCARTYGPQKGATPAEVERAEAAITYFADVFAAQTGQALRGVAGGGAAGGAGAMLHALGARLAPGAEIVLEAVRFEDHLAGIDLVVTGEGTLDRTSLHGKVPGVVARLAAERGIPCVAIVGRNELTESPFKDVRTLLEHFRGDGREAEKRASAGLQAVAARLYSDLFH
jgi:glycerate kinase